MGHQSKLWHDVFQSSVSLLFWYYDSELHSAVSRGGKSAVPFGKMFHYWDILSETISKRIKDKVMGVVSMDL